MERGPMLVRRRGRGLSSVLEQKQKVLYDPRGFVGLNSVTSDLSAHSAHPGGHVQSNSRLLSRVSDAAHHQRTVFRSVCVVFTRVVVQLSSVLPKGRRLRKEFLIVSLV